MIATTMVLSTSCTPPIKNGTLFDDVLPKCTICWTTYSFTCLRDEHAPVQSSKCSHSFCRSCVVSSHAALLNRPPRRSRRSRRIACMVCRAEHAFNAMDLHVNFELVSMMEALNHVVVVAAAAAADGALLRPILVEPVGKKLADLVHGVTKRRYNDGKLHPLPDCGHLFETVKRELEVSPKYPSLQADISWRLKAILVIDEKHPGIISSILGAAGNSSVTLKYLRREMRLVWKVGQSSSRESTLHIVYNVTAFVVAFISEPGAKELLERWDLEPPERRWTRCRRSDDHDVLLLAATSNRL
jgi:RING-type zinc-finger